MPECRNASPQRDRPLVPPAREAAVLIFAEGGRSGDGECTSFAQSRALEAPKRARSTICLPLQEVPGRLLSVPPPLSLGGFTMPERKTVERARKARRQGKAPSTAAGEFVREEMHHIREGKHGARSTKQAIAIGLSKARRAGVPLGAPKKGTTSRQTRRQAERDLQKGARGQRKASPRRSRATTRALRREGRQAASPRALSNQARQASRRRARRGPTTQPAPSAASRRQRTSSNASRAKPSSTRRRGGRRATRRRA